MKELTESMFRFHWKSFKTFEPLGKLRMHTRNHYQELHFEEGRLLKYIEHTDQGPIEKQTTNWSVELKDHKQILTIKFPKKESRFEVITVNHADLVLRDLETLEKVFFVKIDAWSTLVGR